MNYYETCVLAIRAEHFSNHQHISGIIRAKQVMDDCLLVDTSLSTIARSVHQSKFHFIRLFKRYYGRTPHQYLTETRMAKAKQLLLAGNTVTETTWLLGFASTTSFTALFKKCTGYTPSAYAEKQFLRA